MAKVKAKNLFYDMLPNKRAKKRIMADQGASVQEGPGDPRVKQMMKTLPDNYFDIFGGQPQKAKLPGLAPTSTPPNVQGKPFEQLSNPGVQNPNPQRPPFQQQNANPYKGNALLLGFAALDAAIPKEKKIYNEQVEKPQDGYNPYPRGTGSQALADGGQVPTGGGNDPRYKPNGPTYNMGSYGPNWAAPLTKSDSARYLRDYDEARQNPSVSAMRVNHINHVVERNKWLEGVYGPIDTWEKKRRDQQQQTSAAIESYKPITNADENYLNAYEDANTPGTMTLNLPPDTKKPKKKAYGGTMMNLDRSEPMLIPEGMLDNTPSAKDGKWIQKAVNPKHKGYCTPMTKSTCTPRRKALARTFKKHHGFHKKDNGGTLQYEDIMAYGGIIPDNMSNFSPHKYDSGGFLEHIMYHPNAYDMQGFADGGTEGPGPRYIPPSPQYDFGNLGHKPSHLDSVMYRDAFNFMRQQTPQAYKEKNYQEDSVLPALVHRYMRTGDENDNRIVGETQSRISAYNDAIQPGTMQLYLPPDTKRPKRKKEGGSLRGGSMDMEGFQSGGTVTQQIQNNTNRLLQQQSDRKRSEERYIPPTKAQLKYADSIQNIMNHDPNVMDYEHAMGSRMGVNPSHVAMYDQIGYPEQWNNLQQAVGLPIRYKDVTIPMKNNGGSLRGGSDSMDMLENLFFHPSSEDMAGYAMGGSMGGGMGHGGGHSGGHGGHSSFGMFGVGDNESPYPKKRKKKHNYEQGGSVRGGSDTTDMLENLFFHPSASDMKGWDKAKKGKTLTRAKAREILHDGTAQGHPITEKQRRYFGAVASGYAAAGLPVPGIGDPNTPFNEKNIAASHGKLAQDAQFVDTLNGVLSSGNMAKGNYNPDQKSLLQSAYLWKQQNVGRSPEETIQGYYGRPVTTGNTADALRQHLGTIGYGPTAMYHTTPDQAQQQRQGAPVASSFARGGVMYDDGGEIGTMWGGDIQQISTNPNDGGTMQFNGASHDDGGIGMHYNGQPVEVEGGETAAKDSQGNLNIYGNMYLPGTKTKFKSVAKEMGEKEKRYDYLNARGSELVNNSNPANKFEKLAFNAGKAMMSGGSVGQRDLAEKKENLAHLQRAMLDTADEHGLDAQAMSAGNIKKAKKGAKARGGAYIPFAQDGLDINSQDPRQPRSDRNNNPGNIKYGKFAKANGATGTDADGFAIFPDRERGKRAMVNLLESDDYASLPVSKAISKWTDNKPYRYDLGKLANKSVADLSPDEFNKVINTMTQGEGTRYGSSRSPTSPSGGTSKPPATTGIKRYNLPDQPLTPDTAKPTPDKVVPPDLGNIPIPQRNPLPSNAEPLGMNEVLGEMYAAATNKVEPVAMQHYRPEQYTPYQVSFQDRLNQNQSSFNALQRTLGATNPNALGAIAAQKYAADSGVKGEEFRTNQAISNDITNRNIAMNNDAQLKNLALADTQYTRQSEAKSKTKALNQMILNSVSSKYSQNKLENKRLQVYENLYDYRFQPNEQGGLSANYLGPNAVFNYNPNAAAQRNAQDVRTVSTYDAQGNLRNYRTYDDSRLREAKDALELEMQRRRLPLLTAPPLNP